MVGNHDAGCVLAERKLELGATGVRLARHVGCVNALEHQTFAALFLHSRQQGALGLAGHGGSDYPDVANSSKRQAGIKPVD